MQDYFNDMSLRARVDLFFKSNHYIIGKFTVMDLTILLAIFFGVGYALERSTDLSPMLTILIPAVLCVIIERYRIKWRRVKTLRYAEEKAEQARALVDRWIEIARLNGDEESLNQALHLKMQMEKAESTLHGVTEYCYEEDVLGLSDEDE